jgi:hypothetical protein
MTTPGPLTYALIPPDATIGRPPGIRCLRCQTVSFSPRNVRRHHCSLCQRDHDDLVKDEGGS